MSIQFVRLASFEIAYLELNEYQFMKHSHDEYVITFNISGMGKIWLDQQTHSVAPGEICFYNPGQIQGGEASGQKLAFHVDAEYLARFLNNDDFQFHRFSIIRPDIVSGCAKIACSAFSNQRNSQLGFEEILSALFNTQELLHFEKNKVNAKRVVDEMKDFLSENLFQSTSLDEISKKFGLSIFQVLRFFQKETGVSPSQWMMLLRVQRAKTLLKHGIRPSDVAYQLGFSDQSHLNRLFLRAFGITPGRYKNLYRKRMSFPR